MSGARASSRSDVNRETRSREPRPSHNTERMRSAAVRALDSHASVTRAAKKVTEEMEEVTSPIGIPLVDLDDEDSMVIQLAETRDKLTRDR